MLPLVTASGASANSRHAIGTTVFSGMLAATLIGIFLIPTLYVVFQSLREKVDRKSSTGRTEMAVKPYAILHFVLAASSCTLRV